MATLEAPTSPSILAIREPAVFIKVPEIVLLVIAIITFCVNNNGSPAYALSVLLPCLINALVFLAVYLMGYNQLRQTPVELALYSYSVIGLFISSILLMSRYSSSLITSGVFCLFLTIIYGIDVYFSYTGLVNRLSSSSNTESASPAAASAQHPAVLSGHNPAVYPSMAPPTLTGVDEVDLRDDIDTDHQGGVSHTNPVYPTTLNYPPFPLPDTTYLPHFPGGGPAP